MTIEKPIRSHKWTRDQYEWYVEDPRVSVALFKYEEFSRDKIIYDPSCGQGNILKAAYGAGYEYLLGTDIIDRGCKYFGGILDFTKPRFPLSFYSRQIGSIIMNPPFYRALGTEHFIRKALTLDVEKVACFATLQFMASGRGEGLFAEHPPTRVWITYPRTSAPPGTYLQAGNKAGNGTDDWVWIVYDRSADNKSTELKWMKV